MSLPCDGMGAQNKKEREDGVFLAFGIAGLPVGGPHDGLLAQW